MLMRNLFSQAALIAGCGLALAAPLSAQTFTTVATFGVNGINAYGSQAGVVFSGTALYGTSSGNVFKLETNGTGFAELHTFPSGANVRAGLVCNGRSP